MATTLSTAQNTQVSIRKIPVAALTGGAIAAVANLVLFFVLQALGVTFEIPLQGPGSPAGPLPAPAVAIASLVPALFAGGLLALLARFTKNPVRTFWIIAAVFLVLSFMPVFSLPVAVGIQASLAVMHVVAGAAIVWALSTRTSA